jgi:hypothetical protein
MGAALIFSATTKDTESVKIKEAEPTAIVQLQNANR